MSRWGLRLADHRRRTGLLPERLEEICDAEMPKIDVSWFAGQPIAYAKTEKGFRLEAPDELLLADQRDKKIEFGCKIEIEFMFPAARTPSGSATSPKR
jgi:hypothetical protein